MSGAWCFLAGWCSAAGAIGLLSCLCQRGSTRREFPTTTQFAADEGWPETQE